MFIFPMIAAFVLVFNNKGVTGIKNLITKSLSYKDIKIWFVPLLSLIPIIMFLAYGLLKIMGVPTFSLQVSFLSVFYMFLIFLFAGLCEEIGWQGYAYDPLEHQWNALQVSIILGVVWQIWHLVPHLQAHHTPVWIMWQFLRSVFLRVLIVWIYKNTNRSILAASIFHAIDNVCSFSIPTYDSSYVPFSLFIGTALMVAIITIIWGPKTLSRR